MAAERPPRPEHPCSVCKSITWYWLDAGPYGRGWRCGVCHPPVKTPDSEGKVKLYGEENDGP